MTASIVGVQLENVFGPVSVVDLGSGTWSWVGADHLWGCRPPLVTPGLRSEGQAEPGPGLGTDSGPSESKVPLWILCWDPTGLAPAAGHPEPAAPAEMNPV